MPFQTLAVDDRAILTIERPQRYAFGDPAAPLLVLNGVDAAGVMWVCDEPAGWAAPSSVTPVDRKQYGDGGYAGQSYFEERVLKFTGSFAAPSNDAAREARRQLRAAMYADRVAGVLYTHLDETPTTKSLTLLPVGEPTIAIQDRWGDFEFTMVAADPLKLGPAGTYGPGRLPSSSGEGGIPMPLTFPFGWSGGAVSGQTVVKVPNVGDLAANAIYRINGPVPAPTVQMSTGEQVLILPDLATNDVAVIDTAAGLLTINGAARLDAFGAGSTFPMIPVGGCEVRLRSRSGGADPAAGITVTVAPDYF